SFLASRRNQLERRHPLSQRVQSANYEIGASSGAARQSCACRSCRACECLSASHSCDLSASRRKFVGEKTRSQPFRWPPLRHCRDTSSGGYSFLNNRRLGSRPVPRTTQRGCSCAEARECAFARASQSQRASLLVQGHLGHESTVAH